MTRPRVLLLFPPPADCAQPYPSLPLLSAVLEARGCVTTLADLNLELMTHLVSSAEMTSCISALAGWTQAAAERPALSGKEADRYVRSAGCLAFLPEAAVAGQEAVAALRRPETYGTAAGFVRAVRPIDRVLQCSSAANYPAVLSRFGLELPFDIWNSGSLREAVECLSATPLGAWLSDRVAALTRESRPHLVGISLVYPDQLVPSLIALHAVRRANRQVHTCLGGPTASRLAPKLDRLGDVLGLIDSVVVGDGEAALPELAARVTNRAPLGGIPNLVWRGPDGALERSSESPVPLDGLPAPAYTGAGLKGYWVPEPVLLVGSSRSCYWSRCLFCDVSGSASAPYRERSIERVVDDIAALYRTTGARHFMFGDLSIKPQRLDRLAAELARKSLPVFWSCHARLETGLSDEVVARLAQAGCRGLVFGLESASQRILDSMDKGTRVEDFAPILRRCRKAGISVNVQAFIGFPGETEEEARSTSRLILDHRESITSASITQFKLLEGSRAFLRARSLGLRLRTPRDDDLDAVRGYDAADGLAHERAAGLVRELRAEIRAAFPILDAGLSWNAHALLLVSRNGPDALRISAEPEAPRNAAVRLRAGLTIVRLPYHVGRLARLAQEKGPGNGAVPRQPTWTVLDRDSAKMIPLDDRSYALLRRCVAGEECGPPPASEEDPIRGALLRARLIGENILVPGSAPRREAREVGP